MNSMKFRVVLLLLSKKEGKIREIIIVMDPGFFKGRVSGFGSGIECKLNNVFLPFLMIFQNGVHL